MITVKKFQLLVGGPDNIQKADGGAARISIPGMDSILVSSRYLHKGTTEKYFLKPSDGRLEPIEFAVIEEIPIDGEWESQPPPHFYRIELLPKT